MRLILPVILLTYQFIRPQLFAAPKPSAGTSAKQNVAAVVVTIQGSLLIKTVGAAKYIAAKKGQFLYEGDSIKTQKNSLAGLTFVSGVQIKMNSNTEFTINLKQLGKADDELQMNKGQVHSKVLRRGSNFGIRTSVALAAVRGTEYDVWLEGTNQRVSVFEGNVELGNDYGNVNIGAGQYANCSGGEAPQPPQKMDDKDKPDWQNDIVIDDKDKADADKALQGGAGPEEKTLKMEVETADGTKKTLELKFKKEK